MARPKKKGLDYFPIDVYFMEDRKIRPVKRAYGAEGILVYIHILCKIYRDEGYFISVDDDFYGDVSDELGIDEEKVREILEFLIKRDLFDEGMFSWEKVLTSKGLQARYQEATVKRSMEVGSVKKELWLLDDENTMEHILKAFEGVFSEKTPVSAEKTPVSGEKTGVSAEKSTQSKVKESKVNKRKEKKSKEEESKQEKRESERKAENFTPPSYGDVYSHAMENRFVFTDIERFYDYYSEKGFPPSWKKILAKWAEKDEEEYMKRTQKEFDTDNEWKSYAPTDPGKAFWERNPELNKRY